MEITVTDAREKLSEIINEIAFGKKHFILSRSGKKLVALVPIEDFELIEAQKKIALEPKISERE